MARLGVVKRGPRENIGGAFFTLSPSTRVGDKSAFKDVGQQLRDDLEPRQLDARVI